MSITEGVKNIPLSLIDEVSDEVNVRHIHDAEEQEMLVNSIKAKGILQPIGVQRIGDRYRVVYGSSRFNGAKDAGLETIPAMVISSELDSMDAKVIAAEENIHRANLDATDLYNLIRDMRKDKKRFPNQKAVAEALDLSPSRISQIVAAVEGPKHGGGHEAAPHSTQGESLGIGGNCPKCNARIVLKGKEFILSDADDDAPKRKFKRDKKV